MRLCRARSSAVTEIAPHVRQRLLSRFCRLKAVRQEATQSVIHRRIGCNGRCKPLADIELERQNEYMRAYIIDPPFKMYGRHDDRTSAAIKHIAEIVFTCLRRGGDTFQYAVVWADPGQEPSGIFHDDIAQPHVFRLETDDALRSWLIRSVDPNIDDGGDVRSIATCRSVTFGYDGQAFLCLRHADAPPLSSDPLLAVVEERPDLIGQSDYFDGWIRDAGAANGT